MSTEESTEVVELSVEFSGLSISIRGSPSSASRFVQGLADQSAQHSSTSISSVPPVGSAPSEAYSAPAVPVPSPSSSTPETRASILASFPSCPRYWTLQAETQLGSTRYPPIYRANRAWVAGHWARAVNRGRVSSPNRTETVSLGNKYWVVLRCANCDIPHVFGSSRLFHRAVGALEGSDTICHAFPSLLEAKIYVAAAGFEFPEVEE